MSSGGPVRGAQAPGGVTVQLHPAVHRQLVGEHLPDELVSEPVARTLDDEDSKVQSCVEHGERGLLLQACEREYAGQVQFVLGDCE